MNLSKTFVAGFTRFLRPLLAVTVVALGLAMVSAAPRVRGLPFDHRLGRAEPAR